MSEKNETHDIAVVVKEIVQAIPIYQDLVQPAAKEIGTALQTVAKTIHIVLAPISGLVWGFEKVEEFVSTKVADKLKDVPPENIATPKPNVAGRPRPFPARGDCHAVTRAAFDYRGRIQCWTGST